MSGLVLRGLAASFGRHVVLRGIDVDVAPGETLVLFGPSGVGKTVLLRAVAGLEPAAVGQVAIDGRDVSALGPEARGFGMAFQNFALYPHMTAWENIASPLRARRMAERDIGARVDAVAALLRISHVLGHLPRALSNGQKQRTALARALVGEPKVLLLDDPLRNVDAKLRYEMRLELPRLLRRAGAATIYVTQDYREAMALGDRVAVLLDGAIAQLGAPEQIYDQPGTLAVARLFGDPPVNLIPCRPVPEAGGLAVHLDGLHVVVDAAPHAAGNACMLGLRPETLRLESAPRTGFAAAEIVAATPLHERQVLLLRTMGGSELVASLIGTVPPPGARVWVGAEAARALLFAAADGRRVPPGRTPEEQAA